MVAELLDIPSVSVVTGVFSIPLDADFSPSSDDLRRRLALREFIAGQENALVRLAAETLLSGDVRYNPLVFYGATGTGKTHLARGLAARFGRQNPHRKII